MYNGSAALVYGHSLLESPILSHWVAMSVLLIVILLALTPVAVYGSLKSFLNLLAYLAALSLVQIWVKETIYIGFPYPACITSLQMFVLCLVAMLVDRPLRAEAMHVLPVSILNGSALMANNQALFFGGVAFVSMIGGYTPIATFLLELLRGRRQLGFLSATGVLVVCVGSGLCIKGAWNASWAAFALATVGTMLRSMRAVWQHELLTTSVSPMRLVFWNGFWSLLISLGIMAWGEGFNGARALLGKNSIPAAAVRSLALSIAAAVVLSTTQWYAIKQVGALMSNIIGNLNLILTIALSTAWLNETITSEQYAGVTLLGMGIIMSRMTWMEEGKPVQNDLKPIPGPTPREDAKASLNQG